MTPSGGAFSNAVSVAFATTYTGPQTFHYTTSGGQPSLFTPASSSLSLDGSLNTVLMRSFAPDALTSALVSNVYGFYVDTPALTPSSGAGLNNDVTVTVSDNTAGASLYYTLNGVDPTASAGTFIPAGSFVLSGNNSGVKVRGVKTGYTNSAVAAGTFSFVAADPVASVRG